MATLIVEDGTGIAGANSYGTVAGARTYANNRGVILSAVDNDVIVLLINATDYLESFDYVGSPVLYTQSLSWPRKNVQFDPDTPFPSNEIPIQLIEAQYQLCIEQFNGIDLQPSVSHSDGGFVIEEKVDVLATKFSEKIGTTSQPLMPKVDSLLRGLLITQLSLRSVRI